MLCYNIIMIKTYDEIIEIKEKSGGIAVAFGCFDILHYGHVNFINAVQNDTEFPFAVGVLPDEYVRATKGEGRPVNNENLRVKAINEQTGADYAFIVNEKGDFDYYKKKFNLEGGKLLWEYALHSLYRIKPTEFYYSTDFKMTKEILMAFDELKIKHFAVPYTDGISSTAIIEGSQPK